MLDRNDPAQAALAATLKSKLDILRTQNDAKLPPEETAFLRGRIAMLKEILALPEAREKFEGKGSGLDY